MNPELLEILGGIIDLSIKSRLDCRPGNPCARLWYCIYCVGNNRDRDKVVHHNHCLIARLQKILNEQQS